MPKQVGSNTYWYIDAIPKAIWAELDLERRFPIVGLAPRFNVLKRTSKIWTLLWYPGFLTESFPVLHSSVSVPRDLTQPHKRRRIHYHRNPPIIHRKELMLKPTHPKYDVFASLTKACEEAGLFKDTKRIGRRDTWASMIRNAGYYVEDYRLKPIVL